MGLFLPRCRTLPLPLLNLIRFLSAQLSSLSRSCWMAAQPSGVSAIPSSFLSSRTWGEVLQPLDHFVFLLWTCSNSSMSFCWGLQSWTQDSSWGIGAESPPSTFWPHFFWCSPGYGWPSGPQAHIGGSCPAFHPPVLLCRAVLNPFISQPVMVSGVAPTQVQDHALGLVEPHEGHTGPLLELVQVPLDGIPSFWRVNCTIQLGVICKLADSAHDPTVCVINEDIKQYWSQYGPLRDLMGEICLLVISLLL